MSENHGNVPEQVDVAPGAEVAVQAAIAAAAAGAWLLDVREQDEWDAVHVPGVHLIPMSVLNERQGELPRDEAIYVICRSGGRSRAVTDALVRADFSAVNVAGGMDAWHRAGGPTASKDPR